MVIAWLALLGIITRQLVILSAIIRSRRFLRARAARHRPNEAESGPAFYVVLPVLREAAGIAEAAKHFETLADGHNAQLAVVTTQREALEAAQYGGGDTISRVEELAAHSKLIHLHSPDPAGLKADQLNVAAAYCRDVLLGDIAPEDAWLVCYDIDSRPPADSLAQFAEAIGANPDVSVFHQSSRFELRQSGPRPPLSVLIGEGAALRANRFVAGFELPRLRNRSSAVSERRRKVCSGVYAHITGHGLCIRLALVLDLPFPSKSPLEDMQYSFYLGSRDVAMVAVPSLDEAEVPSSICGHVDQAARWFFGPARFARYLRDPQTQPGLRSKIMALSALGSALEWIGCAVVPPLIVALMILASGPLKLAAGAIIAVYAIQLLVTDSALGAPASLPIRMIRIMGCPVATVLFGTGGLIGAFRLLRGGTGVGKTEHR